MTGIRIDEHKVEERTAKKATVIYIICFHDVQTRSKYGLLVMN